MVRRQEARKRTYRPRRGEEHEGRARSVPYSAATLTADHHRVQTSSPKNMEVTMLGGLVVRVYCCIARAWRGGDVAASGTRLILFPVWTSIDSILVDRVCKRRYM